MYMGKKVCLLPCSSCIFLWLRSPSPSPSPSPINTLLSSRRWKWHMFGIVKLTRLLCDKNTEKMRSLISILITACLLMHHRTRFRQETRLAFVCYLISHSFVLYTLARRQRDVSFPGKLIRKKTFFKNDY